jgi:hypothetical protein
VAQCCIVHGAHGVVIGKQFFFEKKNQKTFATWFALPERRAINVKKFFASFFQKRRPSFLTLSLTGRGASKAATRKASSENLKGFASTSSRCASSPFRWAKPVIISTGTKLTRSRNATANCAPVMPGIM